MSGRAILPTRRPNVTVEVAHGGHAFTVTVGYDLTGRVREVFAGGTRIGTDLAHVIADACVALSLALQHGARPADLGRSMGVVPDLARGGDAVLPASVLGAICAAMVAAEVV